MKKEKKKTSVTYRPKATEAITLRVAALAAVLWLAAMIFITWGVSIDLYRQLEVNAQKTATRWATVNFTSQNENKAASGYADYCRMTYMDQWASLQIRIRPSLFSFWKTEEAMPFGMALSYSYNDGERIVEQSSDSSYLYFSYLTAEEWAEDTPPEEDAHYLYIDQSKLDSAYGDTDLIVDYQYTARRLTGWFEGNEFHPVKAESARFGFINWGSRNSAIWQTAYECPTPPGQEVVTVYSLDNEIHLSSSADFALSKVLPITIDGTEYDRLSDLLPTNAKSENLMDAVVRGYDTYVDAEGNTVSVRVALRAQPVQYAMRQLIWFYAVTMSLTWGAAWLILRRIRKNFTEPVAQIAGCIGGGMQPLPKKLEPQWKEAYALEAQYDAAATAYHTAVTRAIQLQTALDYAKNVEEHRRKMISDITHELKTPLAVIHSYAEGLSDGIAADKQEQYLKVILEETERMDGMVLEMLDLSRLEAGKVRLSADQFSLLALTRSVFDRLAPMAEEKKLSIHYTLTEDFEITADESRIAQVITNFATNAIKYTPEGGNIWLQIYRHEGKNTFILTNESEPLPADALEQVWDSFYRLDASRTAKGTGLGLSIARAVVELHGGTVQASNTSEGVEFRFTIP